MRRADIAGSLNKVMAEAGLTDRAAWISVLEADRRLLDQVIAAITVGETYFFRDPQQFDYIRRVVIADARRRNAGRLRAWSAGCSTGEEAYSLAIMLEEEGLANESEILATDISRPALSKAREGLYSKWSLRGEGARLIGTYLAPAGARFQIDRRFRDRVTFAYLNLTQDSPAGVNATAMDLILCRNVLIYLEPQAIALVARRFHDVLVDGGTLITGPSDPVLSDFAAFHTEATPGGLVYRKSQTARTIAVSGWHETPAPILFDEAPVGDVESEPDAAYAPLPTTAAPAALAPPPDKAAAEDAAAAASRLRAIANLGDMQRAAEIAAELAARYPASTDIAYLQAIIMIGRDRLDEAERALKRLLYLDRTLAVAQFTLGNIRRRRGNMAAAARAFRNAERAAAARPATDILPLADGETAGQIAAAAAREAARIEAQLNGGA